MTEGLVATVEELIAFKRYAQKANYRPESRVNHFGNHNSKLRGRGMDFAEVRNYQAGDEIRHMEWRVTARTGRPHVKLYEEERERPVVILCDFNPSMFFGTRKAFKSVIAARLAAMIAWTVIKNGDRVGGLLYSSKSHDEFTPHSRNLAVLPFLAALSRYTALNVANDGQGRVLSDALLRLRRVTRPGSILVIASDFYQLDAESEPHLSRLRAHNDILIYHICDPLELTPPKPQQYPITNGKQEMILDTTRNDVITTYQNYCQQRIEDLQNLCKRLQIPYIQLTAETNIPKLIRLTFPRGTNG
ncbi:DUF58 domain-containing protein [Legionella jordanis]|uniref:DUF58 domain-containing protein n=1 Tax=Legionella jordanis TaxID=456 RepID=A0A0W0VD09_9GAMM|nr:DUF58 domain-containing protein [Legionella jordanis]KTD18033.1 hypothetical protein Ljor_2339 [Legionella jordanis]RMX02280.1 DUF58 domain-containing protein [Legionella jordanis]RMX21235.1 DUF58 domain-containing protein [Legionella jordanis]VEH13875.1 Uncharacterized conserved protein (some members contain a von Willebrand factor type A (vWA) domain) [Legionella jordanis]